MARATSHTRLLIFPENQYPAGGRLDALNLNIKDKRQDLLMDYHELHITAPPILFEREGRPCEQVQGFYQPRCLQFIEAEIIHGGELCGYFDDLPPDHPSRTLASALAWTAPDGRNYYLFGIRVEKNPSMLLIARRCVSQERAGKIQPVALTRNWSPPPLCSARLVPNPKGLHQRYGGDPVAIHLNGRYYQRRLFTGGVDIQGERRPAVHVVLNVGEEASRWTGTAPLNPADRWDNKGEGSKGMDVSEIAEEARWVIERLRAGQRVLVHCAAGMNRSATICCAVLILLEGMSAEAALERVREHHPWARPDSYHWLALRWMARN